MTVFLTIVALIITAALGVRYGAQIGYKVGYKAGVFDTTSLYRVLWAKAKLEQEQEQAVDQTA